MTSPMTDINRVRELAMIIDPLIPGWLPDDRRWVQRRRAIALAKAAECLSLAWANPPKHDFWGAGEADCPRDIKAGNGELHTLRCKVCGLDDPRASVCLPTQEPK